MDELPSQLNMPGALVIRSLVAATATSYTCTVLSRAQPAQEMAHINRKTHSDVRLVQYMYEWQNNVM
jgi:hypothetical protein